VAGETPPARPVAREYEAVSLRLIAFQPVEQGRAEVGRDALVVARDAGYPSVAVKQPGGAVGRVALARNPLIPVVERMGRILLLDLLQPRVLAMRLVEVAVDTDALFDSLPRSLTVVGRRY
jgi:hypothetical protein